MRLKRGIFSLSNYMRFEYLRSLLERGLYFQISSAFEDKTEGYFPAKRLSVLNPMIESLANAMSFQTSAESTHHVQKLVDSMRNPKSGIFVNCWHENPAFSKMMWDRYAGDGGVVVNTTSFSLVDSIDGDLQPLFDYDGKSAQSILIPVDYRKSLDDLGDVEAREELLASHSHRKKSTQYDFENEYRLILNSTKLAVLTGESINGARPTEGNGIKRVNTKNRLEFQRSNSHVVGIFMKVDAKTLIKSIGVVGEKYKARVEQLCEEFGIECEVVLISWTDSASER